MIRDEKIKVHISYRNKTHYLKLGYNAIIDKELEIKTEHLPTSSHVKITAICDICGSENTLIYHKYIMNKNRHGFYGCRKCSRQKAALTSLEKYGVDNYSKTEEFKERVEKTNIKKFGYKTNLISPEHKKKNKQILKEKYGTEKFYEINRFGPKENKKLKLINIEDINIEDLILSENLYNEIYDDSYLLYRNECRKISKRYIKKLYEEWDGYDYYDNEDISNNFNLDHNDTGYPTIDHKISIYHGFVNSIPPEEIADISNLCITKRGINSRKRDMIEEEFNI